ncbi:GNAT family N-acetyltransferase [Streptomyces sp. HNM0575]|uniref:GNAT family N-acetyltransferase n=1 Tax=Streptomyces sp. HNM0575 TaxID=2716338 RepID=UPI00145FA5DE|nr:GNAT family N-acetyltransferase [Streptomyces sp. HNM0575]NLU72022.1 GNAT family N-acetyltransferase [Streptomyces sp. HNM0575]
MDITIRPARDEELDEVGELTAQAYLLDGLVEFGEDDPYLETLRAARRRALHTEVLVAVGSAQQRVLGAVAFVGDGGEYADLAGPGEGEFRMLAVRSEARGRGAGEALVRACVERAREQGLIRLLLCSQERMTTAHRLYERLGFVRAPEKDWAPYPNLMLRAYALEL